MSASTALSVKQGDKIQISVRSAGGEVSVARLLVLSVEDASNSIHVERLTPNHLLPAAFSGILGRATTVHSREEVDVLYVPPGDRQHMYEIIGVE